MTAATFVSVKTMDKKEFRVLKKHCFLAKKNSVEAKLWLDKYYTDSAPLKSTIERRFEKIKRGEVNTEDDSFSGRPKKAVTNENYKRVHKIIWDDCKVKLIEISETLKLSKKCVGHILNEYLAMQKVCAKWLPHEFRIDQKQQ